MNTSSFTRSALHSTLLVMVSLNFVAPVPAQSLIESEQIIAPPAPIEGRRFGRSVAIDNGALIASGWSTNTADYGIRLGELYFYDFHETDWLLTQTYAKQPSPPITRPDDLGAALAIDGDLLVAGAPFCKDATETAGFARQFARVGANWVSGAWLMGWPLYSHYWPTPFGRSVAVSGQTVAVADPEEPTQDPYTGEVFAHGAVYIFVGGDLVGTRLCPTNSNTTNAFSALALSGDTLFVASGNDAVVFNRTGAQWNFHTVLSPSGANFPGLALDGNIAVVNGYVFLRNGSNWTEFQKLTPSTTHTYGPPVAVDGGTIVIGGSGAVSVFDFSRTNFVESLVLAPSNAPGFGASVAISGRRIAVGAPGSEWTDAGAVHIYTRAAAPIRPATAIAELVNGYLVGITLIASGAGYTYAPPIHILGGGGSGASVVATVQNGAVTALRILSPGSGYMSAPTVLIDSPANPLSPPVITGSQPTWIAVDLHLGPGKEYLFESSPDLREWTQLAYPFPAEETILTEEFPVQESTQFFRLTLMPACPD